MSLLCGCSEPIDRSFSYWTYTNHALDYDRIEQSAFGARRLTSERCHFIIEATDSLIEHIESLEQALLDSARQPDPREWAQTKAPEMGRLLAIEPSTSILIGDPSLPNQGPLSGEALREHIAHFTEVVGELARGTRHELFTGDLMDQSGTLNYWGNVRFYHLPLIAVLDELNTIKMNVRSSEMEGIAACECQLAMILAKGDSVPLWKWKW